MPTPIYFAIYLDGKPMDGCRYATLAEVVALEEAWSAGATIVEINAHGKVLRTFTDKECIDAALDWSDLRPTRSEMYKKSK